MVVSPREGGRLGRGLVVFFAKFAEFSSSIRGTGTTKGISGATRLGRVLSLMSSTRHILASGRDSLSGFKQLLSRA